MKNFLKISFFTILLLFLVISCKKDEEPISALGLVKTGIFNDENNDGFAQEGETITYSFTITNTGETSVSDLSLTDDILDIQNVSVDPTTLNMGETTFYTATYAITNSDIAAGEVVNQAEVKGISPDGMTISDLSDDDSVDEDAVTYTYLAEVVGDYAHGYYIVNEGNFGMGNSSITFVNDNGDVVQSVYELVNDEALGDTAQSIYLHQDKAYIVVNNSHKVVVVNRYTMEKIAVIEGTDVNNPRDFVAIGNIGYVSNWGDALSATDDFVSVIDLKTNTVMQTIAVEEGPEDMLVVDDMIYVNLEGGWGQNNKLVIINSQQNKIEKTINTAYVPNSILRDFDNNVWVLCGGKPSWTGDETAGQLIKIEDHNIVETFDFGLTSHPQHLVMDGNELYFHLNGEVFYFDQNDDTSSILDGCSGFYYGLQAGNGRLYALDAKDYASAGSLKVFDLATNSLLEEITTGIIPNSLVFND